ncbi:hypothetical protein [Bacillus sp. P14-1]|nr:hypothetical protein [Bacillus sp. P14-1]
MYIECAIEHSVEIHQNGYTKLIKPVFYIAYERMQLNKRVRGYDSLAVID